MEEIRNENNIKQMEIGQMFFTEIDSLEGIEIGDFDADYAEKNIVETITSGGNNTFHYKNPYKKNSENSRDIMLVALKYIGNGMFEEMTTGEIIRAGGKYLTFTKEDGTHFGFEISNTEYTNLPLNYDDYLVEYPNLAHYSKYEYLQMLQKIMESNIEVPLMLSPSNYAREISEKNKQIYLQHSDEERKVVIQELKKLALLDSKEVNERIASSIEKLKTLTSEDVDMAYLDNQLFDFEHKERTK